MIFSLGYTTFLGLIIFGIMRMIKRKKELNFSTFQLVSGCFNLLISLIFLFIYIGGSELLDSTISNPFIYILFTIFVSYFYILSAPISMGNIIFLVEKKLKIVFTLSL